MGVGRAPKVVSKSRDPRRGGLRAHPQLSTRGRRAFTARRLPAVSFEVFGQLDNVVTNRAALFDHTVACLGRLIGLPVAVSTSA